MGGKRAWSTAARGLWRFGGDVAGEYSTLDEKFSFLVVRNSGHLLPMDLPAASLDMLRRFLSEKTFVDVSLPNYMTEDIEGVTNGSVAIDVIRGGSETLATYSFAFICVSILVLLCLLLRKRRLSFSREKDTQALKYLPIVDTITIP